MLERAQQAVTEAGSQSGAIEVRLGDMEETGLPDGFADVVISNCVINLCPGKDAVYEEALRILRPEGRLAISDIVLTQDVEPQVRERFQSTWAGCLGGAIPESDYWETVRKAGFAYIQIVARHILTVDELEAMACCPGKEFTPPPTQEDRVLVEGKVVSVKFTAAKPSMDWDRATA